MHNEHGQARVVTLGTGGGPAWDQAGERTGIATAVVVEDRVYLIDAGSGVGRQFARAGLSFSQLRGVFITHMHSDHVVDLAALMLFGIIRLPATPTHEIPIVGPGPRGALPVPSPHAECDVHPMYEEEPGPGVAGLVEHLFRAHATDINDRRFDALRAAPSDWFVPTEIEIPADVGFHANDNPTPAMEPFVVFEDDVVRVSATLVKHAPMAPAFGYRFETEHGVVAVSGDTGPTDNVVRLARDADLLLHEALDFEYIEARTAGAESSSTRAVMEHHRTAHTSPLEAIRIASEAGARQLALHHLVPMSGRDEAWRANGDAFGGRFIIPDDLDSIALRGWEGSR